MRVSLEIKEAVDFAETAANFAKKMWKINCTEFNPHNPLKEVFYG